MSSIKDYYMGRVVKNSKIMAIKDDWTFGHIVGFSRNCFKETILVIVGDDNERHDIHPSQVVLNFND